VPNCTWRDRAPVLDVKDALQKMGLTRSEQDLERVAVGLIEGLELRNKALSWTLSHANRIK
jgi:hypothetical protein